MCILTGQEDQFVLLKKFTVDLIGVESVILLFNFSLLLTRVNYFYNNAPVHVFSSIPCNTLRGGGLIWNTFNLESRGDICFSQKQFLVGLNAKQPP
jgi:hypothetical protein